jgi:hypothetical protein
MKVTHDASRVLKINEIRQWLQAVLGPTVRVDQYTDERVIQRFDNIKRFYGSRILARWKPKIPYNLLRS